MILPRGRGATHCTVSPPIRRKKELPLSALPIVQSNVSARETIYLCTLNFIVEFSTTAISGDTHLRRIPFLTPVFLCLFVSVFPARSQTIPAVKAKALDDSEVTLPKPSAQQIEILILGFSKKSGDVCQPWGKRISAELLLDPRVNYYQMPHLEGVPRMVKPMILHGMRGDITPQQQAHFVPLYDKQDEWKKLVNFSAPDDAYIILTDPEGHVIWQVHGQFSESTYAELKKAVASLLEKPAH